jgi:hypothetical protein
MTQMSTTVKVQILLEVSGVGSWGPECTMAQITGQATEAAKGKVLRILSEDKISRGSVKLIGAVKVIQTQVETTP